MNRLNEKVYCGYDASDRKLKNDYTDEEIFKALQKLGRLEDIEEEIGIDLVTLFKTLKGKIYSLHPKTQKICLIILPIFYYCGKQWMIGCRSMEWDDEENSCDSWDCYLKDYGKTWSLDKIDLTKEELL